MRWQKEQCLLHNNSCAISLVYVTDDLQIKDTRVLAAMTHPLRRRLLTLLKVDGPAMASTLADRTGQAVGNISHHLRVLGAAGLIEEAPELAKDRRERWWRRTAGTVSWSARDFAGDDAGETIALAAQSINLDYQLATLRAWDTAPPSEKERWPRGPFAVDSWMRLDDAELAELCAELTAVIRRWGDREIPDDGRERGTVLVFTHGVPGQP
jgi:DNA-binding transcriptional ArsR family regulator